MTTSIPGFTGTFSFSRSTAAWTWSEQLYSTFGFGPGDVVPTHELVLSHQHPEDRAAVQQVLQDALDTGRPHSVWHRLVGAQGSTVASQHVNVKLRDVARAVVEALPHRSLPPGSRADWDALAAELAGPAADPGERTGT